MIGNTLLKEIEGREALPESEFNARKMESVGRVAVDLVHEINHLLTVILGSIELAREQLPEDDPAQSYLQITLDAVERTTDLTQQVLQFARQRARVLEPVSLNDLILSMEALLRFLLGKQSKMGLLLGADLWPVRATPTSLTQLIVNLVLNARDAMPEGGRVTIETSNASLTAEARLPALAPPGDYILLVVQDTGKGMDQIVKEQILQTFFSTKKQEAQSGPGLSLVHRIVTQCGGYILVESEEGTGTTFRIYLPRAE
jgi:two-component system, cell cycle sensor histidine kinase and response regulator CckA